MSDEQNKNNSNEDLDKLLIKNHEYDGIQELDNPLPGWWLWTFLLSIIFAGIYYIHYETGAGPTGAEAVTAELAEIRKLQEKAAGAAADLTKVNVDDLMGSKAEMATAMGIYSGKCAVCHGKNGEGQIGPNLTDEYWIHGKGNLAGIVKMIRNGVQAKGMPPWKGLIPEKDIVSLAAYVVSLRGTKPENPKAPQGEKVE